MLIADILIANEREHYHKGFYIEGEKNVEQHLRTIENPRKDYEAINPYFDAQIFLRRSCDLFALALNKEFGFRALWHISNKVFVIKTYHTIDNIKFQLLVFN